jgi:hypothetical protein
MLGLKNVCGGPNLFLKFFGNFLNKLDGTKSKDVSGAEFFKNNFGLYVS